MKNYSNYSKNYVEKTFHTTRSSYNYGDKRTNSLERVNNDFTESGIPYGYTAKKVSTVYRIPASNEKREIIVNNKYILKKSNNYDDYENSKTFNTRKNKCRCCRCCNCNCHSCSDNRSSYLALKNRNTRYDTYTSNYSKNLEKSYNYGNTDRSRGYLVEKNLPQVNSYRKVYKKYDVYKYNDKSPSPIKPVNMRYITENNYKKTEENYSYDKKPKKYINYKEIKGGRIENRYENDVSKDGKYVVSMTMSKKVMNQDESKKQKEREKEKENEKGKYRRSYYKEEVEEDDGGRGGAYTERKSTIRSRLRDLGDNYKYFERNENKSPLKATITRQKRRQPIHVYGNEYYETNEEVNKYNYYPAKNQKKKITKYYKQEDGEYEKNKNNINDKDYKENYNKDYEYNNNKDYEYKYKKDYEYNNNKDYEDNYNKNYENDNNKEYNDTNNRYFVEKKYEKYEEKNNDNYEDNNNKDYEDNYNKDYEDDNKDYHDNNNGYYVERKYEKYEEKNNDNYEDNNNDNYEDNNNNYEDNNNDNYEENKKYEYHEEHYRENDDGNYEDNNFDEDNNNYEENNDGNYDDNNNENYEKVEKYEYTNYYGY